MTHSTGCAMLRIAPPVARTFRPVGAKNNARPHISAITPHTRAGAPSSFSAPTAFTFVHWHQSAPSWNVPSAWKCPPLAAVLLVASMSW